MKLSDLDFNKTYSYADYLLWTFEERVELIKGKLFEMSPAPSRNHQEIVGKFHFHYFDFFRKDDCNVYVAPFDVRLPKKSNVDKKVYTVVQPDICVVCDKSKLDERGCIGAPDLVVEVLSPGNSKKEMNQKFKIYEESGVREYWLVNPIDKAVFIYILNNEGKYIGLKPFTEDQDVNSSIFPELKIPLSEIFQSND